MWYSFAPVHQDGKIQSKDIENKKFKYRRRQNKQPSNYILCIQEIMQDLAGGERQRVFWKQQYEGTQGIIFVMDLTFTKEDQQKSLEEL